ncbi:selenium-dependent molybdenum cofactor biosynthesis protein YqeB [Desulfonatronum sp. SC1]|uniref:selenium-dependent molybdenum cofactor biosynthesis protein YqeB n=1 Tax=Desulfonatronum sp. SC1 TaxID=2109626 RepID=UPI000D30D693|nr:selenium-dependent molybdenum cofactor biosynthesis protein YqeB [Desulfonatronum sp. SC1]PTN38011.1 molybdenum hydroxylase [Desulfonatronum sp. SC1]
MLPSNIPTSPTILIRGAGDLATGVALELYEAGLRHLLLLERDRPLAVRRLVAFSEAVFEDRVDVEGIAAFRIDAPDQAVVAWAKGEIPVLVDPDMACLKQFQPRIVPQVLIDALLAKRNTGVHRGLAPLVIGLGPGFIAGKDVHCVVETHRGHGLGEIRYTGSAFPNTGIPGPVLGKSLERLLRAPRDGVFTACRAIGDMIQEEETVGQVEAHGTIAPVTAQTSGVIRGLLRSGVMVEKGLKLGDVDPRGETWRCRRVSDKARAVGRGVLQAVRAHLDGLRAGTVPELEPRLKPDSGQTPPKSHPEPSIVPIHLGRTG